MQNPFGAKITHTVDRSLQQFLVVFDKSKPLASRKYDAHLAMQSCEQVFFIDPNIYYLFTLATQAQIDQLKKLNTVVQAGGINVDFERLQKFVNGDV